MAHVMQLAASTEVSDFQDSILNSETQQSLSRWRKRKSYSFLENEMNRNQYEIARRARIVAQINRQFADSTPADRAEFVEETIEEELQMEAQDRAEYLETIEDSPCLQSANIWGTGEGQFHGVI